ncbi:F0F1 ATP synthase subunit A [Uniformispora flossi]|uniref:F0F1 ATP synthase subunit A n=1 Tax=Uniformispora flossi TaxID=3390723 RepID=UPI003C2BE927
MTLLASDCHLFDAGCGFPAPGLNVFEFKPLFTIAGFGVTKPMLLSLLCAALVVGFFAAAFARPRLVPRGIQNVGELGYLFVRDSIARETMGRRGDRFVPFLVSMFFFLWTMNLMSIVPLAQFPVTSRIAYPAVIVGIVWVTYIVVGIRTQGGWGYLRNIMFPPGLPAWVYVLVAPLEFVHVFVTQPFTLAVRLFANMFAGHMLLVTFSVASWYLLSPTVGALFSATSFVVVVLLVAFELFIQALQAYIFTLLAASYLASSLDGGH